MRQRQRSSPPSWFVILLAIAIVFGLYYLWIGLRNFVATGATVVESTRQAIDRHTATAVREQAIELDAPSPLPSFTPIPACQDFVVRVRQAIVRAEPSTGSRIVKALDEGATVCVIAALPDSAWYLIDDNPVTRRIDRVYMHGDIIRALHPTATPTPTFTPSKTPLPTLTFTPRPRPTSARSSPTRPPPSPPPRTVTPLPAGVSL